MTGPEERAVSPEQLRPEQPSGPAAVATDRPVPPAAAVPAPDERPVEEPRPPAQEPRPLPASEAPTSAFSAQQPVDAPPYVPPSRPVTTPVGVPPRSTPLPPPRGAAAAAAPRVPARPQGEARLTNRGRRARLTLRRIDPWSVFLYSVVASIFLGLALLVCVAVLYALLSKLGVLESVNTLVGDVTKDPADTSSTGNIVSAGRVLSVTAVIAAADVVLLTGLATLGAFLYNLCASLTGGIELTFGDRE